MSNHKISIIGDGLEFKKDITFIQASQIMAFIATSNSASDNLDSNSPTQYQSSVFNTASLEQRKISPREVLNDSKAKTYPQKIAVIGKYLIDRDHADTFSTSEVREILKKSGEPLPANFARDIRSAIASGYIFSEGKNSDSFYLTDKGRHMIENRFNTSENESPNLGKRPKGKKKIKGSVVASSRIRDEVKTYELPDAFLGLTYWSKQLNKGGRILWLLGCADDSDLKMLTTQEIEFLSSRNKDHIGAGDVNALTKKSFKDGLFKITHDNRYQILKPGIDYLEAKGKETV